MGIPGEKKSMTVVVISVLLIVLLIGGLAAFSVFQRGSATPLIVHAVAIDERTLLVEDSNAEWRSLSLDGTLGQPISLGTRAGILAHSSTVLWVSAENVPLAAYRLPGLTRAPSVDQALRTHGILTYGIRNPSARTADGALVVSGANNHRYKVTTAGEIERLGDEEVAAANRAGFEHRVTRGGDEVFVPVAPWDGSRSGRGQELGIRGIAPPLPPADGPAGDAGDEPPRAAGLRLSDLELIEPRAVMDWARGVPMALRDPDSYLVASEDPAHNHRLSRVAPDGSILWTVAAEELLGPTDFGGGERRVLWLAPRGRHLVVLVNAWRPQGSSSAVSTGGSPRGATGETRLVTVDPARGTIVRRVELRR